MSNVTSAEIAVRIFSMLTALACKRETITYTQLHTAIAWGVPQGLGVPLNLIKRWCEAKAEKLPPLHVLVVREDTQIPGVGAHLGADENARASIAAVYQKDWTRVPGPIVSEMQSLAELAQ